MKVIAGQRVQNLSCTFFPSPSISATLYYYEIRGQNAENIDNHWLQLWLAKHGQEAITYSWEEQSFEVDRQPVTLDINLSFEGGSDGVHVGFWCDDARAVLAGTSEKEDVEPVADGEDMLVGGDVQGE